MAAIHDLLAQVQDQALRERIEKEIEKMSKTKKFGLVFEEHLPECTPLYDVKIKKGSSVARKAGAVNIIYEIAEISDGKAKCVNKVTQEIEEIVVDDLVAVAEFGESVYPYLKLLDSISNTEDKTLWHTLIEADNFHALQLLEYLYAGKVDCIYIDPPYNTGARDWKYNNNYVDSSDVYRHSKWLSMMEKRLKLAKNLMNPKDSMMMITIDDIELCHLRVLLDSIFSECDIQIVDMVINPKGKARVGRLSQVDEYLILVYMGAAKTISEQSYEIGEEIRWPYLRRSDVESARGTTKGGTQQFYPIYVSKETNKIVEIGKPLTPEQPLSDAKEIEGTIAVFPIREDGKHMNWGLTGESLSYALDNGCVRVTKSRNENQPYNFAYVTMPSIKKALDGEYIIEGEREDGTKIITLPNGTEHQKPTSWKETHYDANAYGTKLIGKFLGEKRFSFPKSLYSVLDSLSIYLADKKQALVLDFFAGSGTTLHAINLLNAMDGGNRRCILCTNNEVSDVEAQTLLDHGVLPGSDEWNNLGIARYVTWPRTVCSITGKDVKGKKITGDYCIYREEYTSEKVTVIDENGKKKSKNFYVKNKVPVYPELENYDISRGFKTNAVFFKLGFLDKTSIALGRQLKELLPVLWLKAGAIGACPVDTNVNVDMIILHENRFAILINERCFSDFSAQVDLLPEIRTLYFVTDSEAGYREMISSFEDRKTYQLYRDYLDNFRISVGR